jgi:hypothetical protein
MVKRSSGGGTATDTEVLAVGGPGGGEAVVAGQSGWISQFSEGVAGAFVDRQTISDSSTTDGHEVLAVGGPGGGVNINTGHTGWISQFGEGVAGAFVDGEAVGRGGIGAD